MTTTTQTLNQLLDRKFVAELLTQNAGQEVREQLPRRVLLTESQLAEVKAVLKPLPDHANTGLVGSYQQRLLICNDRHPPGPSSDEDILKFQSVSFTFAKTPIPKHEWEWDVMGWRQWLDYRHEDISKKQHGYDAVTAYERICQNGELKEQDLAIVFDCARSHYWVSWDVGIQCLGRLAANYEAARESLVKLASEKKAAIRHRAIAILSNRLPKLFCLKVLQHFLEDRSSKNRANAVWRTHTLHLTELLDDLAELQRDETSEDVLEQIDWAFNMLQHGFHYDKQRGALWVRCASGMKSVGGARYTREHFESTDLEVIVEEIRSKFADSEHPVDFAWPPEPAADASG